MSIWYRLSAEDESCSLSHCEFEQRGDCPYFKARRRAENSHVIIVNHSLLLSDVMTDGRVLPEYHYLVVDEAQHFEDAVTNSLSFHTDRDLIKRQLKELGDAQSGLFGEMLSETLGVIPQGFHETLEDYVGVVTKAISEMRQHVEWFFEATRAFIEATNHVRHNEYAQQVRITTATRAQPGWSEVEMHWDNLSKFTSGIAEAMTKLVTGFSELQKYDIENFYDISASLGGAARRLSAMHARLLEFLIEPDGNTVYWVDFQPGNQRFSLNAAPIEVGQLVKKHIWYEKDTVIMTSATMRTDDSFTYIRNRLGGDDAEESVIATPFDYRKSTLLYVVSDIPEPTRSEEYQTAVENCLRDLCIAAEGRTMVLFTSYAQLQETTNAIGDDLRAAGIEIYDQSEGISRSQMLDGFKTSEKAVLMGTRSFWEGVDIPGPSLSILVIIRLPFSVPTDPVFAARSETFDNAFTEYSVPDAILRFRQGFGRLIRRKQDHGVVVVFDPRIYTKQYGRMFINSLPDCTIRRGTASQLPHYALEWLDNRE
jgi:DNA polymerase-3 subunit epsilon/ATP-dependent DNA helicase DinG